MRRAADFETIAAEQPKVPADNAKLASAFGAVPFIRQWCATVEAEVTRLGPRNGKRVIGPDGSRQVRGRQKGGPQMDNEGRAAEAALTGHWVRKRTVNPS